MDTAKEYIEMCGKAKEIQDGHIPERGDWYLGGNGDVIVLPEYDRFRCDTEGYESRADCDYLIGRDEYVWLPRQDQLQNMIRNKDLPTIDLRTMELWWEFFATHFIYFKSLEQIWLGYVMAEKYNKIWKTGDWVNDS